MTCKKASQIECSIPPAHLWLRKEPKSKWTSRNPIKRWVIGRFLKNVLGFIPSHANLVLDVGCGEGIFCNYLLKNRPTANIIGIDISPEALKTAKKWNPATEFICASIYSIPLKSASADLTLCMEVLEHLEKPKEALKELKKVTGHLLILSVPNSLLFRFASMLSLGNLRRLGEDADHVQHYSLNSLEKFLKSHFKMAGFKGSFPWLIAIIDNTGWRGRNAE